MYKIPQNNNYFTLNGKKIIQITFGLNFVTLFFENGFIQFSGAFYVENNRKSKNYDEVYPVNSDYGLLEFLDKEVVNVSILENNEALGLDFQDNFKLILKSNEFFESFVNNIDGHEDII